METRWWIAGGTYLRLAEPNRTTCLGITSNRPLRPSAGRYTFMCDETVLQCVASHRGSDLQLCCRKTHEESEEA